MDLPLRLMNQSQSTTLMVGPWHWFMMYCLRMRKGKTWERAQESEARLAKATDLQVMIRTQAKLKALMGVILSPIQRTLLKRHPAYVVGHHWKLRKSMIDGYEVRSKEDRRLVHAILGP